MKKSLQNIINKVKANQKVTISVVSAVVGVIVIAVCVTAFTQPNKDKVPVNNTTVPTTAETTSNASDEAESTTEAETEPSTEKETETSTKAPETTTKKRVEGTTNRVETTTKKVETTTKKNTNVTFNGHKPYEVFVDEHGNEVYYDEYGCVYVAVALTAAPGVDVGDECPWCGKPNCGAYMESWHCVVCNKDIAAHECHPKSHLDKSV